MVTEDKIYLMLGELRATQEHILKVLTNHADERKELDRKISSIQKKINYAAGAYAAFIGIFTFAFNYFTSGGTK